ncbi:hypothetical protein [Escherichia coli]|uniref:hypothetical protein n=1 Tax=Escherichia coli TaxID=562 RepID=UPI00203CFBB0|nr:hypothetical protein [Escherichia coli]MDK3510798.1 hypothetical protein [Escherichia coli]MDK3546270.1 hypothetical protein [Escherichia coli]
MSGDGPLNYAVKPTPLSLFSTSLTALSDDVAGVVARDVVQVPKQRSIEPDGSVTWSGWTDYVVKEPQPDGTGLTNIFLEPHTSSENSEYSKY